MTIRAMLRHATKATLLALTLLPRAEVLSQASQTKKITVPKMWDDAAMEKLEVPLANPIGSPKQAPADYYYRIPVRTDLDRSQLPAWMNEPVKSMPLDWDLLRKNGSDWLRYWDTEIRGRSK